MWPINKVVPSGSAFAASVAPIEPPAPGLLSTATFWPNANASFGASARARMSVLPPGVKGTMMRIGLADCARSAKGAQRAVASMARRWRSVDIECIVGDAKAKQIVDHRSTSPGYHRTPSPRRAR